MAWEVQYCIRVILSPSNSSQGDRTENDTDKTWEVLYNNNKTFGKKKYSVRPIRRVENYRGNYISSKIKKKKTWITLSERCRG